MNIKRISYIFIISTAFLVPSAHPMFGFNKDWLWETVSNAFQLFAPTVASSTEVENPVESQPNALVNATEIINQQKAKYEETILGFDVRLLTIDSELEAGIITNDQAKSKKTAIEQRKKLYVTKLDQLEAQQRNVTRVNRAVHAAENKEPGSNKRKKSSTDAHQGQLQNKRRRTSLQNEQLASVNNITAQIANATATTAEEDESLLLELEELIAQDNTNEQK